MGNSDGGIDTDDDGDNDGILFLVTVNDGCHDGVITRATVGDADGCHTSSRDGCTEGSNRLAPVGDDDDDGCNDGSLNVVVGRNDGVTDVDVLTVGTILDGDSEGSKLEDGDDDGCLDGTIPVVGAVVVTTAAEGGIDG